MTLFLRLFLVLISVVILDLFLLFVNVFNSVAFSLKVCLLFSKLNKPKIDVLVSSSIFFYQYLSW